MKKWVLVFAAFFVLLMILLVLVGGLLVAIAFGFIKLPFLAGLAGMDKPKDLGVKSDPALFDGLLGKTNVKLADEPSDYCLTCNITYSKPVPMDVTVNSGEMTSYIRATNDEFGLLRDTQIRLLDDNLMEVSSMLDLKSYGYDFAGPVYAVGSIEKKTKSSISIVLSRAESGIVPVPGEYLGQAASELESAINAQLARMPGLDIETLEIKDGELHFKGDFPSEMDAR